MTIRSSTAAFLLILQLTLPSMFAQEATTVRFFGSGEEPFRIAGTFNPSISSPEDFLGHPLGERPVRHAQVLEYFKLLEATSSRVKLFTMGSTYEGRPLIHAVIASEERTGRLEHVKAEHRKIADPRAVSSSGLSTLLDSAPAVVWLAYSIHGDEVSGVDASLAVGYHLAAGQDELTQKLLNDLVVIIDPIENPDGRERFLAQMEAFSAAVPHGDGQSLQKGGFWPWGRGNHYLFDMNRDWFTQELPESKARIAAIVDWSPQLLVDAHEMGQWDTYLFNPPRHPFIPQLSKRHLDWWDIFADDQAEAFDKRGWPYYTREWNEEWYPGYGSSWPLLTGAVGILYEQAGVSGSRVSRHDGTVLTYSEAVEHQYVSSISNLTTAANNRRALLSDYHDYRAKAIETYGGGPARSFLVRPDDNPDRLNHLASTLRRQGIEIYRATEQFSASARSYYSKKASSIPFPSGTLIIPANQPQGYLAQSILGFDPQIPDSFLLEERRELLKHRSTRLYEITSWSLLQAYGLDAYESGSSVSVSSVPWEPAISPGQVLGTSPLQGFLFEAGGDRGVRAIASFLRRDVTLYAAHKELDWEGKKFSRGSIFIPKRSNSDNYEDVVRQVATETGITVHAVNHGLGKIGPDLGGRELEVLRKPTIALVAGGGTSFTNVGWIWQLLDQKIGYPVSLIEISQLSNSNLEIYNTIVLPSGWTYSGMLGKSTVDRLKRWVQNGGTLIAMGSGAAFCADSSINLSSARKRRQILKELEEHKQSAMDEIVAEKPPIDELQIWDWEPAAEKGKSASEAKPRSLTDLKKEDEYGRLFSPRGAILQVRLDTEEWLTFGLGAKVPVMVRSSTVLMAKHPPVRTVGRFAAAEELRISGLLWPEARERIANSSFCTRERSGRGQVILFSDPPNFRAFFRGSERLLSNALLLGTGLGTSWTPEW